jgi:uncharacterized iron-regulated membrane protein
MGIASGLVVFIVALTGAIYVFQEEVESSINHCFKTEVRLEQKSFLTPSVLIDKAKKTLPEKNIRMISYEGKNHAVKVWYSGKGEQWGNVSVNPYNGYVICIKDDEAFDFFYFIIQGHLRLWIPFEFANDADLGNQIVKYATLIFALMLITGIILWWPKNKNATKLRFSIKWNVKWKRRNYDLHSVLGFYASWIVIFMVITGLAWGFEWMNNSIYYTASGGKKVPISQDVFSDTSKKSNSFSLASIDKLEARVKQKHPESGKIDILLPQIKSDVYQVWLSDGNPINQYKQMLESYDQYSLQQLSKGGMWSIKYEDGNAGDKLQRLYGPIHYGSILGLPTKIIVFFACLVLASLPITGFMIWWGRKKKTQTASRLLRLANAQCQAHLQQ